MSSPHARSTVAKMAGYTPGEQPRSGEKVIKLNTNENPYPPSPRVFEAIRATSADALRRYPQPMADDFRQVAARTHGVSPAQVLAGNGSDDILHAGKGSQWPLISRLLADEVYAARYREHLSRALEGLFAPEAAAARIRQLHALIASSVVGERGERPGHTTISSPAAFERSVDGPGGLREVIEKRHAAIRKALASVR